MRRRLFRRPACVKNIQWGGRLGIKYPSGSSAFRGNEPAGLVPGLFNVEPSAFLSASGNQVGVPPPGVRFCPSSDRIFWITALFPFIASIICGSTPRENGQLDMQIPQPVPRVIHISMHLAL